MTLSSYRKPLHLVDEVHGWVNEICTVSPASCQIEARGTGPDTTLRMKVPVGRLHFDFGTWAKRCRFGRRLINFLLGFIVIEAPLPLISLYLPSCSKTGLILQAFYFCINFGGLYLETEQIKAHHIFRRGVWLWQHIFCETTNVSKMYIW